MKQQPFNAMEFMTAWGAMDKEQISIMLLALSKEVIRGKPVRASGELAEEMLSATTLQIWKKMARPNITNIEDPIKYFRKIIIRAAKEVKYSSLVTKPRKARKLLSEGESTPRVIRMKEKHEPFYERTPQLDDRDENDAIMSRATDRERVVLSLLMEDMPTGVIATTLNVTPSAISKIKRRFFDRIKNEYLSPKRARSEV